MVEGRLGQTPKYQKLCHEAIQKREGKKQKHMLYAYEILHAVAERATELGRLLGQSPEYQAVKRASDALNQDTEAVALLEQMERLRPFFPRSHGRPRVDDRRVLSGIVFVNRNGLRWRDAPSAYGPHKTLYNRWKRWGERGVIVNRRPKRTPYRRAKGTPFVEQRDGYDGRFVRAGCGVGRA